MDRQRKVNIATDIVDSLLGSSVRKILGDEVYEAALKPGPLNQKHGYTVGDRVRATDKNAYTMVSEPHIVVGTEGVVTTVDDQNHGAMPWPLMVKFTGIDGKEYGPYRVGLDEVERTD